jgi:hypothetical protein
MGAFVPDLDLALLTGPMRQLQAFNDFLKEKELI